ncbi:MAG: hypothetical protein E7086_07125 [Bacteroidales bacterium]|nr:hypothetical protein [Bacteroidales bacterium]
MKKAILITSLALVFLALFNGLFFFIGGTEHSEANWVSYGFIHVAYACILLTPLFCRSGKKLEVLSYSLYLRAFFYFFTELVIGVICIWIDPENSKWPLIIQGVLLAIFLVLQIMSVLANDSTAETIQKQKTESMLIQDMAQRIRVGMREISDSSVKKLVERCYDAINNSSIQSFPEAADVELELRQAVDTLCTAIEKNNKEYIINAAKSIDSIVKERNAIIRKCRIN